MTTECHHRGAWPPEMFVLLDLVYVSIFFLNLFLLSQIFLHFNRYRTKDIAMIIITKSLCSCNGFE